MRDEKRGTGSRVKLGAFLAGVVLHVLNAGILAVLFHDLAWVGMYYLADRVGYETLPAGIKFFYHLHDQMSVLWLLFSLPVLVLFIRFPGAVYRCVALPVQLFLYLQLCLFLVLFSALMILHPVSQAGSPIDADFETWPPPSQRDPMDYPPHRRAEKDRRFPSGYREGFIEEGPPAP